ncbi:MAG: hypothetical protein A4S09_10040 [Proteobacteria bacterium SG_bin7]|nr:MAG: hypothetical protein A4S09_10040 [Proteobacteria bacterium SG_bin7]
MTARKSPAKPNTPNYLNIKDIGSSVKEMGSDMVKTTHQNVVSHWYHSDMDADLIVWRDEKQNIIKQQVNLLGQVIEWNIVDGLRTGFVVETEQKDSPNKEKEQAGFAGVNEVKFDRTPAAASVTQAIELIHFLKCISESDKDALSYNLKNAPKIASMEPGEFLKKFGRDHPGPIKGFWQKIIRRFFR